MHIILYVLDALRADHLSCYGYKRKTTPYIDSLAQEGVVFKHCFTSTTWTRPVAASILTGTYPGVHLTRSRYEMFSTNLERLPERLKSGGFKTAAFSTMGNIASDIGFNWGFDHYYDLFRDPDILAKRSKLDAAKEGLMHATSQAIALPRAEDVNCYLFPWLADNKMADTFNFIWSIETHVPYTAPTTFRRFSDSDSIRPGEGERDDIRSAGEEDRQRLMNLYDDVIFYNDHCIGQIIHYLKEQGIYNDTLFIILGDHGDAFYEHGFYAHGHAPYEELLHVPLIMKFPEEQFAGRRITALTELIDIYPTITAVAGLADNAKGSTFVQGHNLISLLNGEPEMREYVFSDTRSLDIHNRYLSVRDQRWKYIQIQRPKRDRQTLISAVKHVIERRMVMDIVRKLRHFLRSYFGGSNEYLFDLKADPGEQNNLATERPDMIHKFRQILQEWQQENSELAQQIGNSVQSYEESEVLRRHLEGLGYL